MKIFIRTTGERSLKQFGNLNYQVLLDEKKTGCRGFFKHKILIRVFRIINYIF